VLQALLERGLRPSFVVGVSVGAINGTYLAARPTLAGVAELAALWEEADARRIFGTRFPLLREVAAVVLGESAVFSIEAIREFLELHLPVSRFEDTSVPLALVATELGSGTTRTLSSGNLVRAVLASCAIPGLFPAVEVDGEMLFDGAIADPVPVDYAVAQGARRVVVVEAGRSCGCGGDPNHVLGLFQRGISIVMQRRMDLLVKQVPSHVDVLHLGLVCHPETPVTDLSDSELLIRLGYEEAQRRIGDAVFA
jgi:NTE family protein